ncbi:tRNA pseudouridine(65) synthase TruC [Corallincola platygyrae]|uniref:tRNA pseudouridine synthase C n=1 Tax=Corallincola platygyrae TaxID=1193278 RepID=A0ABW4XRT2_9GAMM
MDDRPLPILYQDEDIVIIDKPAGMLVHRSFLDKHETRFVMQTLRNQLGQHVFPVHRLDKPTSGCLVFALNSEMANRLAQLFELHQVNKEYHAIVRGYVNGSGTIDYALKPKVDKVADRFSSGEKEAQSAVTDYVALKHLTLPIPVGKYPEARYSLLRLKPKTGRKHQLRRHLAHISHPIVGDTTHGDGRHNRLFRNEFECHELLLRATSISFEHPLSGRTVSAEAEWTANWLALLERENWTPV